MGFLQDLECHSGTTKESSLPQSPLNIFHPLLNLLSDRILKLHFLESESQGVEKLAHLLPPPEGKNILDGRQHCRVFSISRIKVLHYSDVILPQKILLLPKKSQRDGTAFILEELLTFLGRKVRGCLSICIGFSLMHGLRRKSQGFKAATVTTG